jgi:hypothetical protein
VDVDIKSRHRKYTFSKRSGIQSLQSYLKELKLRLQDEKEIKLGLLLD